MALRAKESSSHSWSFGSFIFDEANTVITRLHIKLIFAFRVDNDLIDLITFDFLMLNQHVINYLNLLELDLYSPDIDLTDTVTYEKFAIIVKHDGIGVLLFDYALLLVESLLFLG